MIRAALFRVQLILTLNGKSALIGREGGEGGREKGKSEGRGIRGGGKGERNRGREGEKQTLRT